jgi:3-hydroxybutyrate dehydrogenase
MTESGTAQTLRGKKALITGGAGGIGAACARALAAQGAFVVVADRDGDAARALAEEINAHASGEKSAGGGGGASTGGGAEAWEVDLLDTAALESLKLDVDILVNNAGIQRVNPIESFVPADFRLMLSLMVEVPFLLVRAALPHMYEQGYGRIINISSIHGLRASAFKSAYVTAKHGLEGFSKVTALEGGPHGVTSNCVNPGYVRTALVESQIADQAATHNIAPEDVLNDVLLEKNVLKRLVDPSEVADLVAFLASPTGAMVTGASYVIDGGWTT